MQIQTQRLELSLNLKALTLSPKEALASSPRASPRNHITFPLPPNPNPNPNPNINADYIGTESCVVDLLQNDNRFDHSAGGGAEEGKPKSATATTSSTSSSSPISMRKQKVQKEFPPPIPLLARTQNLHSHMPWVLKRYYTPDGRLILKEEKVRHHEYFRAHRANGRLTLQLVPLDDDVLDTLPLFYDLNDIQVQNTTPRPPETNEHTNNNHADSCIDLQDKKIVGDDEVDLENDKAVVGSVDNNGGVNCLNCCLQYAFLGCPLHPIRTVHG